MNGSSLTTSDGDAWDRSVYWQQQFQMAHMSRDATMPHSYARIAARASKAGPNTAPQTVIELAMQLARQNKIEGPGSQSGTRTPARAGGNNTAYPNPQEKKDQIEEERQRHINEDINKQFWTAVDLSGQGLLAVSPKIVNYDFLQKLYLNQNNLSTVPLAVTKMTQLKVLDISHNALVELRPEIGRMVSLRYLLLFDNMIETLPAELGALFQLEMLGIDGNPLGEHTRDVFAKEGTKGLIVDLRDSAPAGTPPRPREWIHLDEQAQKAADEATAGVPNAGALATGLTSSPAGPKSDARGFTIFSYNTLCDRYATPQMYGYTASWALSWDYRSQLLISEVSSQETDIICLQEVNKATHDNLWLPALSKKGYKSIMYAKTRARTMASPEESALVDGCVIFYKADKIRLVNQYPVEYNSRALRKDDMKQSTDIFNRVMTKDNIALIAVFEIIETQKPFIVTNTHLHWDPAFKDVKLVQTAILLEELEAVTKLYTSNSAQDPGSKYPQLTEIKQMPVMICGDFNSTSDSGVYQLFNQSTVTSTHPDLIGHTYGNYTENGIQHRFNLKSAYADGMEMPFTNYTPNFVEEIDHIWYSTPTLQVTDLLGPVDAEYAAHYVGFPNAHHPSDHVPIAAHVEFTS